MHDRIALQRADTAKDRVVSKVSPRRIPAGLQGTLMDLQRTVGNQAVGRLVVQMSSGQLLDRSTLVFMESRFGHDFSQVRVHTDSHAHAAAELMSAQAFTVGNDVVFRRGGYEPQTMEGRHLLAHELAHMIQQRAGSVNGGGVSDPADPSERVATSAANAISNGRTPILDVGPYNRPGSLSRSFSVQRQLLTRDVNRLSDTELTQEIDLVRQRITTATNFTPNAADQTYLNQLENEYRRRTEAAQQRAPLPGILTHLALLGTRAATERDGPAFHAALDGFRRDLQARVAAVPPHDPLPDDLRLVMAALMLWSTDPGNQWGEGVWDSRDLILTSVVYATVPAGQNKCNAYVAEVVYRSLGLIFSAYPSAQQPGRYFPYRARDWGDATKVIPHFPVVARPVMGDILSTGTHVGVYLGSYNRRSLYVSARDDPSGVFGLGVQHEHGIQIKYGPSSAVFRHYTP